MSESFDSHKFVFEIDVAIRTQVVQKLRGNVSGERQNGAGFHWFALSHFACFLPSVFFRTVYCLDSKNQPEILPHAWRWQITRGTMWEREFREKTR